MYLRKLAIALSAVLWGATTALADDYGVWGGGVTGRSASKWSNSKSTAFPAPSLLGAGQLAKAITAKPAKPVELASGGEQPLIKPKEPDLVQLVSNEFSSEYGPGSIVVDTSKRRLYYILSPKLAYSYPIAVGKEGFAWTGTETVSKVVEWPEWMPPDEMRERKPELPIRMTGGLENPLGARAIYLGKSFYRIHGTNAPGSIGSAASSGCFRMHNKHVVHLAGLVTPKKTKVYVLPKLPKGTTAAWKPNRDSSI